MRKRPVSIAILLLVLGFVLLYYTMQKQYMEFQNTCNQKMEELRNTALLWESNGLLEDSFVSGTFCAESGTAQLYIEVSPVEKSEELQVVLTCQGKAFPLTRTGSRFMGELEVPADTVCRISQVTVTSGQAVQTRVPGLGDQHEGYDLSAGGEHVLRQGEIRSGRGAGHLFRHHRMYRFLAGDSAGRDC